VAATARTTTTADRAKPGDRSHRVHAGESLWSIASDTLGVSAAPVRIAREVHRLWQLNHERIGTGRPDLLMIGTTLKLR
jgi:nucleoid-associated protein YgaU